MTKKMTKDEAYVAAQQAIGSADEMIKTFVMGLRQFEFFNPETGRETKVSTLIRLISEMLGEAKAPLNDGILVLAATAIVTIADQEKISVPAGAP